MFWTIVGALVFVACLPLIIAIAVAIVSGAWWLAWATLAGSVRLIREVWDEIACRVPKTWRWDWILFVVVLALFILLLW